MHKDLLDTNTVKSILQRVLVVSVTQPDQFVATICKLDELLIREQTVNLIVIDSFTFMIQLFGAGDKELLERTRIVSELMSQLHTWAHDFNVAVLLTNDFTTVLSQNRAGYYTPSLGATFYHKVGQRLILGRKPQSNLFYATLDKSLYNKSKTIEFKVCQF